jgi:cell wall-associated NlpC family hydrolase
MEVLGALLMVLLIGGCAAPGRVATSPAAKPPATRAHAEPGGDVLAHITNPRARELILYALATVGVPYRYGGSSPETGFDCSGLVQYVYSRGANRTLPRNTEALSLVGTPVTAEALAPGDLVFFDTLRRPYSHVGIYLGERRFIHAPATGGHVELVDLQHRYWQSRFNGARRLEL